MTQLFPESGLLPTATGYGLLQQQTLKWFQGTSVTPTMSNAAVPYIYGNCAFADIADALSTATAVDHRIYLLGWGVDPNTRLTSGTSAVLLRDLLSKTKAQIRGMFFDNPLVKSVDPAEAGNNKMIVDFLNSLPNGAAIMDHKLPFALLGTSLTGIRGGGHHQKLLVVYGSAGMVGFTGGMDINNSRIRLDDTQPDSCPLHDVQVRITGYATQVMLDVFSQRWLDHPDTPALEQAKFGLNAGDTGLKATKLDFDSVRAKSPITSPPNSSTRSSNRPIYGVTAIGIGRTYCNLREFSQNEVYSFAQSGEETAWKLISKGVSNARRFIYIEDQYFVSRRLKSALLAKLSDPLFQFLLILMQDSSIESEFPLLIPARNDMRAAFSQVDPSRRKWRMFSLRASPDPFRQKWCGSYVHSKTQIYDDECAIIGSCNADDRGYSYDTEIVACITDDLIGRSAGSHFARDLRIALWHKHLGVPHAQLIDWTKGLQSWLKLPATAMVVDNSELEDDPQFGKTPLVSDPALAQGLFQWTQTLDPDADLVKVTRP